MASDSWTAFPSNCDFTDATLKAARGYNWYDLDQIRTKKWIDLTKTNVVGGTGLVSGPNLTALLNDPDFLRREPYCICPPASSPPPAPGRAIVQDLAEQCGPGDQQAKCAKSRRRGLDCTVIAITGTTTTDPNMPPLHPR